MRNNNIIIGITGGSGAGKTTVSEIMRKRGIPVFDADIIAREIVQKGKPALDEIARAYEGVILPDGTLDRKKLGSIVFSDKSKLELLNKITHKYITQRIHELIDENTGGICGIDGAVLIESGIADECDVMCFVTADEKIRADRIVSRDNISYEQAVLRIKSQKSDAEYMSACDCAIYNNGDVSKTEEQLDAVINKICREYR